MYIINTWFHVKEINNENVLSIEQEVGVDL